MWQSALPQLVWVFRSGVGLRRGGVGLAGGEVMRKKKRKRKKVEEFSSKEIEAWLDRMKAPHPRGKKVTKKYIVDGKNVQEKN